MGLEIEPHQDPPSNIRVTPQITSFTRTLSAHSPPKPFDSRSPTEKGEEPTVKSQKTILDRTKLLPPLDDVFAVKLCASNFRVDFTYFAPDLVHHSSFEFKPLVSSSTEASTKKRAEHVVAVAAPPLQCPNFVFDPGGNPTITVRRNHREFQKTAARTVTVMAPPPQRSTFVFDPGGYRRRSVLPFLLTLWQFAHRDSHASSLNLVTGGSGGTILPLSVGFLLVCVA